MSIISDACATMDEAVREITHLRTVNDALIAALQPISDAHEKAADPIGDSDLYDEQPRGIMVTLGDFRRARRALAQAGVLAKAAKRSKGAI